MILLEHPFEFFAAFFLLTLGLGAWLDRLFVGWRIKRLQERIDRLKTELALGAPKRAIYL